MIVNRSNMDCRVDFTDMHSLGNGITRSWFSRADLVRIGISDFQDNPDEQVDSYDFMKLFVSTLHELTHVYQKEQLLHDDSNSAKYLALGEFAASCSQKYYELMLFFLRSLMQELLLFEHRKKTSLKRKEKNI